MFPTQLSVKLTFTQYDQEDDATETASSPSDTAQYGSTMTSMTSVHGEAVTPASVGPSNPRAASIGPTHLAQGPGASGLIGKLSEISWLETARDHILQGPTDDWRRPRSLATEWLATQDLSYHLDEANLLSVDEESVDEYQWPSMAATMAGAFFDTLYPTFPFVNKEQFLQELSQSYFLPDRHPLGERRRWLAMANMIFCLGSKWLMQGSANSPVGQEDHLVYYARARKLGLDHRIILDHPTPTQVDALGLVALYLTMNHQITRAWQTIANAIRHAVTLGMHLAVHTSPRMSRTCTNQASTWYALYNLEMFLVEMTGRPTSMISDLEMTVSQEGVLSDSESRLTELGQECVPHTFGSPRVLQRPVPQQSLSTYFSRRLHVSRISRRISTTLYAGVLTADSAEFQGSVLSVELEIEELASSVARPLPNLDGAWLLGHRHNLELVMSIRSLQMILYRPFLCDWEGKSGDEALWSHDFVQSKASAGVAAARSMLALLFSVDDLQTLPLVFPCWSTLHYVCQAGAILVLELAMHAIRAMHLPSEVAEMESAIRRLLTYLKAMSKSSYSAHKAWEIFAGFLNAIESRDSRGIGGSF
ncbi:hypothetical protein LTR20_007658 [Exophiala xenobiotica]|nr:hypothetical protein LTR92_008734 [Exophiala xenobiotica]KAK5369378.1 hypothetical protein LTS13_007099 [Exophiala xenobiotica]KAK5394736.1 hypothetical protein LTR79_008189 [Exophiala xenobiotica]KAK5409783.1 hypothetical protein LTR90_008974 [Exophiala xenobiotica]KAK5458989.1 hypothetical protein LTR20_007658 [Exophiala xenobiotica]